ncbi:MAG: CDP-archaeol synthase [candidate division NC10 bacterium]|nr:CDP-archaeol synthase [candidate division NC10 bacterium]
MWTFPSELVLLCAKLLWLAAPVMLAAAIHIVVIRWNFLSSLTMPLDFGRRFRGERLFGNNKTCRGAIVMIAGSSVGMALQQVVRVRTLELFDYGAVNAWLWGGLLGLGFIVAELPNSFLKRQCGVPPGQQAIGTIYWLFTTLDQLDSVIGCLLALAIVWTPPWQVVVTALLLCSLVHIAFNLVFVHLGLKRRAL